MGSARYVALGGPALEEALQPLQAFPSPRELPAVLLGLPPARHGTPLHLADALKQRLEVDGRRLQLETFPGGHSSGMVALKEAFRRLHSGQGFCLIGGVDSYLQPETLEWLDEVGQLKSPNNRWGFVPGEAACFCLLASSRVLRQYKLKPLARVLSVATVTGAASGEKRLPCTGEELTRAFLDALSVLPQAARVDGVIGDLNGERHRTDEYGFTLTRLGNHFVNPSAIHTPADRLGDIGAASGPVFMSLAALWAQRGYARGPLTLVWTSGVDGTRGAALLEVFPKGQQGASWV